MMDYGKISIQKMNIENRILQIHPYRITPPKTEGKRWQTYVKTPEGERLILRAPSYDGIMSKLFDHYFVGTSFSELRFEKVFAEWLEYKTMITSSPRTIRRHEQHYRKYLEKDWGPKKLKTFDRITVRQMCNELIKVNGLTSKEWQNVKTIIGGVFWYACEKKYIEDDPLIGFRPSVKFRQVNRSEPSEKVFQTAERVQLLQYFERKWTETGDPVHLALLLDFYIGLRVGELTALRWCDVIGLKSLHVCREEVKNNEKTAAGWREGYIVEDHTKTHTDRTVPLVPAAVAILNRLRLARPTLDPSAYIFTRDGHRITSRQVTYALEKACIDLNIKVRRTHAIRRTVASLLSSEGVPLDTIRHILGHSNSSTTLSYIYNPLTEEETYKALARAL